jgi:deoxycytidylate deaminase/dephospho-CoA kinase
MIKEKKKTAKTAETAPEGRRGRSNLVIGLTGPFGSGCSAMLNVLEQEEFDFVPFKISDDIRDELQKNNQLIKKGKPGWRRVLQEHGNKQRKGDRAYWINKVIKRIDEKQIGDKDIVIDGFRNFKEVEEIRKIYPRFFLVAICAEKDERWKRVRSDYKGNSNEFEEDDRRDQNEDFDWGQSVQRCVDDADYVYYNNEHLVVNLEGNENPDTEKINRKLKEQAKDFVPLMKGETGRRDPKPEEVQITAAYAQSNSSTCLKRHVGAVITVKRDGQQIPISMGFNENPPNIRTCKSETCYKDEDMNSKLKARGEDIYCPSCGEHHRKLTDPWVCKKCGTSLKIWLHPNRNMELCTAIHAEERAILSLGDRRADGATLYVTTFPCFQCARLILDAGIKNVLYVEAYPVKGTGEFLIKNGVSIEPFSGFTARAFFRVFPKVK